jgi:DNA polymerase III delta subunit
MILQTLDRVDINKWIESLERDLYAFENYTGSLDGYRGNFRIADTHSFSLFGDGDIVEMVFPIIIEKTKKRLEKLKNMLKDNDDIIFIKTHSFEDLLKLINFEEKE